jgi:hypothetical protein
MLTDAEGNKQGWSPLTAQDAGGGNVPFFPVGPSFFVDAFQLYNIGGGNAIDGPEYARGRTASIYKVGRATTTSTVVWTPAAGFKFVVLGFTISVCAAIAADGVLEIDLVDDATTVTFWNGNAYCAGTTPVGDTQLGADFGRYGYTSETSDGDLVLTLSEAPAAGSVGYTIWGIERVA